MPNRNWRAMPAPMKVLTNGAWRITKRDTTATFAIDSLFVRLSTKIDARIEQHTRCLLVTKDIFKKILIASTARM